MLWSCLPPRTWLDEVRKELSEEIKIEVPVNISRLCTDSSFRPRMMASLQAAPAALRNCCATT